MRPTDRSRPPVELVWPGKPEPAPVAPPALHRVERAPGVEDGWTNLLIEGDNRLALAALLHGDLRTRIEAAGGLKLVYLDPPFHVGTDFTIKLPIGEGEGARALAYRDAWGEGDESYLSMVLPRLRQIHELLAPDGVLYLHCDWRVDHWLRVLLDEVFGPDCYRNTIAWRRDPAGKGGKRGSRQWPRNAETILCYSRTPAGGWFDQPHVPLTPAQQRPYRYRDPDGRRYKAVQLGNYSADSIADLARRGLLHVSASGKQYRKYYLDEAAATVDCLWTDISGFGTRTAAGEQTGYGTQKPEALLERILLASSREGDLVADFFCGSGTTLAVAERLGRRWLGCDDGRYAVLTCRKRLLAMPRRWAFERLEVAPSARAAAGGDLTARVLAAYGAGPRVEVAPPDEPAGVAWLAEQVEAEIARGTPRLDVLACAYGPGAAALRETAGGQGLDLRLRLIPRALLAARPTEVPAFLDLPDVTLALEAAPEGTVVRLTGYHLPADGEPPAEPPRGGTRLAVAEGQLVRLTADRRGQVEREVLTATWSDWVDAWAVDFAYDGELFVPHWQSARTWRRRHLELVSAPCEAPGRIAVRVIDVLGNETVVVSSQPGA